MPSEVISIDSQEYIVVKKLEGRGQSGFAAFCRLKDQPESPLLLIKEDDPGTCLAESTADVLPEDLPEVKAAVNIATLGTMVRDGVTKVVSIQPAVEPSQAGHRVIPFDVLVYGRKRNPRTLFAEEYWNSNDIKRFLAKLRPQVKQQIAHALFCSVAAGDESLHIGQFMAEVKTDDDGNNVMVRFIKIDFGARERFAIKRERDDAYDPTATSKQYTKAGQFGKHYIGYMLQDLDIRKAYLDLWKSYQPDREKIIKHVADNVLSNLNKMPRDFKIQSIKLLFKTINKGGGKQAPPDFSSKSDEQIDIIAREFAMKMGELAANRIIKMHEVAVNYEQNTKYVHGAFIGFMLMSWYAFKYTFISKPHNTNNVCLNAENTMPTSSSPQAAIGLVAQAPIPPMSAYAYCPMVLDDDALRWHASLSEHHAINPDAQKTLNA